MFRTEQASLDRRRFLEGCAAFAACGVAASVGATAGSSSTMVDVDLDAREAIVDVAGAPARLLTYNGLFPGPLIRAREGEQLRGSASSIGSVEPTNLHFHGLHVSPADNHDNVFVDVQPGERLHLRAYRAGRLRRHLLVSSSPARPDRQTALAGSRRAAGESIRWRRRPPPFPRPKNMSWSSRTSASPPTAGPEPHGGADWARGKSGRIVFVNGALGRRSGRCAVAGPAAPDQRLQRPHAAAGARRRPAAPGHRA